MLSSCLYQIFVTFDYIGIVNPFFFQGKIRTVSKDRYEKGQIFTLLIIAY